MYTTTTDLLEAAYGLQAEAKRVSNRLEHSAWWDRKVDLLHRINDSLASGAFIGEAYDELQAAKSVLNRAEILAGGYAEKF